MTSAASEPAATGESASGRAAPRAPGPGRALVPVAPAAAGTAGFAGLGRSHGLVAAGVAVAMGLSFTVGTALLSGQPSSVAVAQAGPPADTTMDVLVRMQGEVRALKASLDGLRSAADGSRQDDTIRGLKRSVDTLKGDLEGVKAASTAAVGQLGVKLDRLDRDPGPKLNEIASRLDRLDREPSAKLADVTARLDRIERQIASADTTGSLPPQAAAPSSTAPKAPLPPQRAALPVPLASASAPAQAAAAPPPRPEVVAKAETAKAETAKAETAKAEPAKPATARTEVAKPEPAKPEPAKAEATPAPRQEASARLATVEGWMLRDVYGGVALLERRAGGLREVAPGEYVPGVGEIRSIERRGREWVVVTSRGIIQADNRW